MDFPYLVYLDITYRVTSTDGKYEASALTEEEAVEKLEKLLENSK